eukprot:TRINITY_DN125542_c0_g1_i1.p1 TRINITY_DN125542_c0_g1~~TRINITY_DN125542_c0_g1_i1.p1  ORF type:complete len:368 (+),score=100.07 TRINITY_DN125542_c0_g1_i1:102-1205(+)
MAKTNCKMVAAAALTSLVNEDPLLSGLIEALGSSVSLASLFCLPSLLSLFEGDHPAWQATDTSRIRRSAWPLLKDPDSLLTIQLIIRCFLIWKLARSGVKAIRAACGKTATSRTLASAATVLFLVAYTAKMFLFQYPLYHLEGPMGGAVPFLFEGFAASMLLYLLGVIVMSLRMPEAVGALLVAPCILSMLFGVACANYLEVAPEAGAIGNAAFTLSELADTAGCLLLIMGPGLGQSSGTSFFLAPIVIFQQGLGLYYFLDSLEKSPQSTLSFGAKLQDDAASAESDEEFVIMQLPMFGQPEELLLLLQSIEFAAVVISMIVYTVRTTRASNTDAPTKEKSKHLDLELSISDVLVGLASQGDLPFEV